MGQYRNSRLLLDFPRKPCHNYSVLPGPVWGCVCLAEIRLQEGESLENALRRFKRKVQQEDIIKEVKRHSFYLKPGEKKRVKAASPENALAKKYARSKTEALRGIKGSPRPGVTLLHPDPYRRELRQGIDQSIHTYPAFCGKSLYPRFVQRRGGPSPGAV